MKLFDDFFDHAYDAFSNKAFGNVALIVFLITVLIDIFASDSQFALDRAVTINRMENFSFWYLMPNIVIRKIESRRHSEK